MEIFYDDEVEQSVKSWTDVYHDEDVECDIEIYGVRDSVQDEETGEEFEYIYFNFKTDKELSKEEKYTVRENAKNYIYDMDVNDFELRFEGVVDIVEYTNGLYC